VRYVLSNVRDENVTVESFKGNIYCNLYGDFGHLRKLEPRVTVGGPLWIIMLEPGEQVRMPGSQTYEIRRPRSMHITGVWEVWNASFQPPNSGKATIRLETNRIPIKVSITGIR